MTTEVDTEEGGAPEWEYLLLDDHGARTGQFKRHIADLRLSVLIANEAIELEDIRDSVDRLDGAIIDFHLNTSMAPGYTYLRYPCTQHDCPDLSAVGAAVNDIARAHAEHDWHVTAEIPSVDVTTGLGAMLYLKQHAPDVPLYGFCELSANHSLMFLLAARTWLGASAINAETPPDALRRALMGGSLERELAINAQLDLAARGFQKLTDSLDFLTRPAEAFDWLNAYRLCGERSTLAEFKTVLNRRFDLKTLESDIYIKVMRRWQASLAFILEAFNKDTRGWPDLHNVETARHWDDDNPVLRFLKSQDYQTFFTAPDARAALAYHRANGKRIAADDPLGGY